jgi:Uma2 family endonuclease
MSVLSRDRPRPVIVYPDSDGKPMAENTLLFKWIVTIKEGLERIYFDRADVFVAGDLFWYPLEGHPEICTAPGALVAFGRPKGDRGSYKQFDENGIAPQVVFEVLSPGNRAEEMSQKFKFYEKYGVDEYYIYDLQKVKLTGYLRADGQLRDIAEMNGWISPLLGIQFDLSGSDLVIYGPGGHRFLTYQEIAQERDEVILERDRLVLERDRVAQERDRLTRERDAERERAERMAAQLRAIGVEPPV